MVVVVVIVGVDIVLIFNMVSCSFQFQLRTSKDVKHTQYIIKLDDGWPESEKHVFQAALSMVVVKNSR